MALGALLADLGARAAGLDGGPEMVELVRWGSLQVVGVPTGGWGPKRWLGSGGELHLFRMMIRTGVGSVWSARPASRSRSKQCSH